MDEILINDLEIKAISGDVESMIRLGDLYYNQYKDERAKYYYERASDKGDLLGRIKLANILLRDFYDFVIVAHEMTVEDTILISIGAPEKIIKGLRLMFSIFDCRRDYNISDSIYRGKIVEKDLIIETAAFYLYFIYNDFRHIRRDYGKGKFLDSMKSQIEDYGFLSEMMISKYYGTPHFENMRYDYRSNKYKQ